MTQTPLPLVDAHLHMEAAERLARQPSNNAAPESRFVRILESCVEDLAAHGAARADLRLNPLSWLTKRGVSLKAQAAAMMQARAAARDRHGLQLNYLISLKRRADLAASLADYDKACRFARDTVAAGTIGIDISRSYTVAPGAAAPDRSGEQPLSALSALCRTIREAGLDVAVHAGWFDSEGDLWSALEELGATRIGHGTPLGTAMRNLDRFRSSGAVIEICPAAAVALGTQSWADHPAGHWAAAGIPLLVGSDHPLALATDIASEQRTIEAKGEGVIAALDRGLATIGAAAETAPPPPNRGDTHPHVPSRSG